MNTAVCPWWAGGALKGPFRRWVHNPKKITEPYLKEGMLAGDIGSGMGYFTVPMAALVGKTGQVIAADIQPKMLEGMHRAAVRAGVETRITAHLCPENSLGMEVWAGKLDFVLLSMALHEMPDRAGYAGQTAALLKPGGVCLFIEPVIHVPRREFIKEEAMFLNAGLSVKQRVKIPFSRALLLEKRG